MLRILMSFLSVLGAFNAAKRGRLTSWGTRRVMRRSVNRMFRW